MNNFTILNKRQLKKMTQAERIEYQKQAKKYFGNLKNQLENYEQKEKLHPILLNGVRIFPFVIINKLNDINWPIDNGPVIFSVNHSNSKDFPVISRLIKKHFFIIADYTMKNDFFVDMLNMANGCIYVDRESKESGQNAIQQAIEGVNKGYNMAIFPETTWNLLNREPMLPRKWGDLKIAQQTGRPIIPIALAYTGCYCFAKFGKTRYVRKHYDLAEQDADLYEEMSQLRTDIWNSPEYKQKHKEVSYEEWLRQTIKSYKNFDVEYELSMIRKEDNYLKEQFDYILEVGEEIHPVKEIEKRLQFAKINYRIK